MTAAAHRGTLRRARQTDTRHAGPRRDARPVEGPPLRGIRRPPDATSPGQQVRRGCHSDKQAFWTMLRTEGLTLATDRLVYFAHWITPEESPVRFDTRFFAAEAPAGQEATLDGKEVIAVRWLGPREAIDAAARG